MSWYSKINIFKTAAAKSKIQRYKIANPSVKFLIHRYENDIPWDEVEKVKQGGGSADDYIQNFVSSNLMPALSEKISNPDKPDDPNNNFMSPETITDEYIIQQLIATEEAHGMTPKGTYTDAQIQGGRNMIVHDINNEKATQFNDWWKYLNEEEIYSQDPAFQYSVLKPVIDSSPPDKKNSSPPLNAEILSGIWDEIVNKGVDQMNILKKYRKAVVKAEKERAERDGIKTTEKGGRWIRIKGGPSVDNPKELKENINRLKNLSQGTGWCTGRGMADTYLPQGDFYLYLENDKAVVAIRCVGNDVSEIRGYDNNQKYLDPYWQEVIEFLSNTNLNYEGNSQYKALQDIYLMNVDLEEGSPEFNTVLKQIQSDHTNYLKLSDENKQKFPIFKQTAAVGYGKKLEGYLSDMEEQATEGTYLRSFDYFQEYYENIPPEIKAELPEMQARVIQAHKRAYNNNPNLFPEFSPEIQKAFTPEEQEAGWINYVNIDPYHYNDSRIPEEIKAKIPLEPLKAEWEKLISHNADHIDYMGKNILELFGPGEIEQYVLKDFASFPAASSYGKLTKLERVEKFVNEGKIDRQEIINVLANEIRSNPGNTAWINRFPDEYKNEVMGQTNVQTIVEEGRKNYVIEDTGYFKGLSVEEQNVLLQQHGAAIGEAFAKTLPKYVGMYHNFWESVPANVRPYLPFDIIEATAQFYANEIKNNPNQQEQLLKMISPDIQPFVFSKLGASKSWYKRANYELV
jgi:hypothetical protein